MGRQKALKRPNGSGSVYNAGGRRRKPWRAVANVNGQRIPVGYFESKTDALDALALYGLKPASSKDNYTLERIYEEMSEIRFRDISKQTYNNYQAGFKHLITLHKCRFKDIRASDYQKIIDELAVTKSRSTLEKVKTVAVMVSTYGMENDIIDKNYGSFVKLPKAARGTKTAFSEIEVAKIEQAVGKIPFADCILIMIYSGWRINEFLGLTLESYNAAEQTLTGGLKTEAGKDRTVPIHPKISALVAAWAAKKGKRLICKGDGSKYTDKYFRENCYLPALRQIGVRELYPHECRHTFATLLHKRGVDAKTIAELMGHTDYSVDAETYIHVDNEELKKAVSTL